MTEGQKTEIEMLVHPAGFQLQCAISTIDVIGRRWAAFGLPRHELVARGRELQAVLEGIHAALDGNPGEA